MTRYGCWDCGSEVAPFQGRCVVCGWPAPPPRRAPRGRLLPILLIVALLTFTLTFVVARATHSSVAHEATMGQCVKHRMTCRIDGDGREFVCKECGLTYRLDNRRRGTGLRYLQSTIQNP